MMSAALVTSVHTLMKKKARRCVYGQEQNEGRRKVVVFESSHRQRPAKRFGMEHFTRPLEHGHLTWWGTLVTLKGAGYGLSRTKVG